MIKWLFLFLLALDLNVSAQNLQFQIGDLWPFQHAYVRDFAEGTDARNNPNVQLHDFRFNEGLAAVEYNYRVGFIDSARIVRIPFLYQSELGTGQFDRGKAVVVKNGKWGVIDRQGKTLIPFAYDKLKRYDNLYYIVQNYGWGYIDTTGKVVLPLGNHARSHIMSNEAVYQLAEELRQKEAAEAAVPISKHKAISIAKREKLWIKGEFPFEPIVKLDMAQQLWIIQTSRSLGTTRKGDCANTNGCLQIESALIHIDCQSGKVKERSRGISLMPIFE